MKNLVRVWLKRLDGIDEIRWYNKTKDILEMKIFWSHDNVSGKFAGITHNGYLKYKEE